MDYLSLTVSKLNKTSFKVYVHSHSLCENPRMISLMAPCKNLKSLPGLGKMKVGLQQCERHKSLTTQCMFERWI